MLSTVIEGADMQLIMMSMQAGLLQAQADFLLEPQIATPCRSCDAVDPVRITCLLSVPVNRART